MQQAKQLTKVHTILHPQISRRGILVGGKHSLLLGQSDKQVVADISNADVSDVSGNAFDCRSVWKATHDYDGLLYREKEFIVIIKEGQGEAVAQLNRVFSTSIAGVYTPYLDVQIMERVDFTAQGLPLVKRSDEVLLTATTNLSRKVMLFPSNQNEDGEQLYIVMDFMRRIFPVAVDTVVVPYFPVADDMVNVKGDDGAVWKARVLTFSLRRQVVRGRFFVEGNDSLWVPETTRPQEIHFKSILGLAKGSWVDDNFTTWQPD